MANEYVQPEELKATIEMTGTDYAENDIPVALEAASRAIDQYCGRRFYPSDADVTRYYTPERPDILWIDDLVDVTTISTDPAGENTYTDAWATTDYVLEPRNATLEGWPYTSVRRVNGGSFFFPSMWPGSVKIVGTFGWASAPPQVKEATTILATQLLVRAREAPFGVVSFNAEIGTVARIARVDPQIRLLIDPFRRWRPFV